MTQLSHQRTHWTVPLDHPAFAGHFPGMPILPGVVLLDIALLSIANARGLALDSFEISTVKFLSPVNPGETLSIEHTISAKGTINFDILVEDRKVATGSFVPESTSAFTKPLAQEPAG
ncbi:MAG: hypothetical protein WBP13_00030 [Methylophilaceae bacterium]